MQNQKSFKEELKRKQKSFLLIGMFVALGMSLMAFEWASFQLENIQVDEFVVEDLDLEPAVEIIEIEQPKPRQVARVKEKEFDPLLDNPIIKKVDDIDSIVVNDPKAIVDPKAGDDAIVIVDLGGGSELIIEKTWIIVEKMPSFPGGEKKLYEYLGKNIKFTQCAKEGGVQGKVYVQFVVEKDGSITNITTPRGLTCGLNEVAEKAVKNMPNWTPGEQRGKKVRVKYTLPVYFKLQ